MLIILAASLYAVTMGLGIIAKNTKIRFGKIHHIFFFFCCLSTLVAAIVTEDIMCWLPAVILAVMPLTKKGSQLHTIVGTTGFFLWLIVIVVTYLR